MNRQGGNGRPAVVFAMGVFALAGCASMDRDTPPDAFIEAHATSTSAPVAALPGGWPEDVPIPEGVPIDGVRCSNRYCTLWFGLMNFDEMMALRRDYVGLIRKSGKWEQLGTPGDPYEHEAFRYTGTPPSGCGYTWEIRQGQIPGDYHHRWRVFISLTW